jgi:hypothetical protein
MTVWRGVNEATGILGQTTVLSENPEIKNHPGRIYRIVYGIIRDR